MYVAARSLLRIDKDAPPPPVQSSSVDGFLQSGILGSVVLGKCCEIRVGVILIPRRLAERADSLAGWMKLQWRERWMSVEKTCRRGRLE
jgi:hypothetical protein